MATCQLQLAIAAAYLDRGMEEEEEEQKEEKKIEEERDRRVWEHRCSSPRNVEEPERTRRYGNDEIRALGMSATPTRFSGGQQSRLLFLPS